MNTNYFEVTCIRTLDEFIDFTLRISKIRSNLSYFNFTKTDISTKKDEIDLQTLFAFIKIVLYSIVILLCFIGNALILLIVCFKKSMKKSTNFFICNLAICDLAILFSCIWVQILETVNRFWILGQTFCKVNSYLQMVSIISTVLTLLAISCERYIGILHPIKAKQLNKSVYYVSIALIWTISLTAAVPILKYRTYTERQWLGTMKSL